MQKQTWETKAGFLACCGVSKQNALVLASFWAEASTWAEVSSHQLSTRSWALWLWLWLWLASIWVEVSSNQLAKRPWALWIGHGLGLWLWLESSKSYFDFRWRIRAARSYMLGVCLKTTFWRLNSIRNSFHKKFISIRKTCIQTHKTQCLSHCSICNPGRQCRHQGRLSLWLHKEQWPKDRRGLHWACTPCTDSCNQRSAWRAPRQLHHYRQVFPGV